MSLLDQKQGQRRPRPGRGPLEIKVLILLAVVLVVAAVILFPLKSPRPAQLHTAELTPVRYVDFSKRDSVRTGLPSAETSAATSLRVAVAPVLSPEESIQVYQGLVEYLAAGLGRQPVFLQRKSYAETNDLVRYGQCDLALVCTYSLVRGELEFGMELLVVPVVNGATEYHSLILVSEGNPATSLEELRGQRFASADIISTSGWLYPAMWLKERGIDANKFFSEHLVVGSHDRSVRAVVSGYADAAAVHSFVYEQVVKGTPEISRKTRIIQKSPPYGMPPVVVSPEIDPGLRAELKLTLLNMHQDPVGISVLKKLNIDKFVVPDDALYDDIRSAVKIWEAR